MHLLFTRCAINLLANIHFSKGQIQTINQNSANNWQTIDQLSDYCLTPLTLAYTKCENENWARALFVKCPHIPSQTSTKKKRKKNPELEQFCLIENQQRCFFRFIPHSKRKHGFSHRKCMWKKFTSANTRISISFVVLQTGCGKKPSSAQIYLKPKFFSNLWWVRVILHDRLQQQIFPLIDGIQNLCRYVWYLRAFLKISESFFSSLPLVLALQFSAWNAKTESDSISISIERLQELQFVCVFASSCSPFSSPSIKVIYCFLKVMGNSRRMQLKSFHSVPFRSLTVPEYGEYDSIGNQNRNVFNWKERTPKVEHEKKNLSYQTKMYGLINHLTKKFNQRKNDHCGKLS